MSAANTANEDRLMLANDIINQSYYYNYCLQHEEKVIFD